MGFGPEACRILAPRPGIKPSPLALEGEALTTGPSGKSIPSPPLPCMFMLMPSGLPHHTHTHTHTWTITIPNPPHLCCGQVSERLSHRFQIPFFFILFFNIVGYPGGLAIENPLAMQETHSFDPWVGKIPWRRAWQPTPALAWRIPWTEDPGGLQSRGSKRVRHD